MSNTENIDLQFIHPDELEFFKIRDVRSNVVEELTERIEDNEYNPSRPLRVVKQGGDNIVADGNHRLKALKDLGWDDEIPCVVETDVDIHNLAVESNRDEEVYAEMDLFDYLDIISELRDGHTQEEIGDKLGWGRGLVAKHVMVLDKVVPAVREMARRHQEGRGTEDVPAGTFDFGENWFRTSGIYDLTETWETDGEEKHAQVQLMEWFCEDKSCEASKGKVEEKAGSLLEVQSLLQKLDDELNEGVDSEKREELREEVIKGTYSEETIESPIKNANKGAKDRVLYGEDSLDVLPEMEDNSIDCVVTDPPWGVEFESRRETGNPDYDDDKEQTMALLDEVFEELKRVCAANAHLYIIFPIAHYTEFQEVASRYFDVNDIPLMWVKNNHAPGDFDKTYAKAYEPIYLCRMDEGPDRELNVNGSVATNVLEYQRPSDRWHDSQKPVELLEELICNSTGKGETVLDPFAGSGVTMLAAAKNDRHYVGIEKDDTYESDFTRELREIQNE